MKDQQKLECSKRKDMFRYDRMQHTLLKDKAAENGIPLTAELYKKYKAKGAKFMFDLKNIKFVPGERVYVSENVSGKTWSSSREGIVVGDYPFIVQINHGKPWSDISYSKQDILIGKVRIKR